MKRFIKNVKNSKTLSILGILIIGVFFLLVTRVSYGFMAPVVGEGKNADIKGTSSLVDDFKFELGDPLNINATSTTLSENGTNYVVSSNASLKLKANNTNNTAIYNYNLILNINENTFTYIEEGTPEILMTITSPSGDELTNIDGLTYGTFSGVSGFDITTKTGEVILANQYSISSNSSNKYTEQEWIIKITYLNHTYDQSSNFGHSMKTELSIKR